MDRSHVIRLNPTPEQEVYFRKACGVARHAYNWALARWKEYRAEGKWAKLKDLKAEYNSIKGLSKGLSRKVEGSRNWWKNTKKLAKAHYRVACQRQDTLHKMTVHLARTYALIGLEDLNTKGMLANHCLAQAVSDASFFEVQRQLLYKTEQYGGYV